MAKAELREFLLTVLFLFLLPLSRAEDFEDFLSGNSNCAKSCTDTYSPHTYEKNYENRCCKRGCRLFSIMESMTTNLDSNTTRRLCHKACDEAYEVDSEISACSIGCDNQKPWIETHPELEELESEEECHFLYPLMYVHNIYSNMFDKVKNHMTVQWTLYMSEGNGQLVVIQSVPQTDMEDAPTDLMDSQNTPYGLESNLLSVDRAATPDSRRTQLRSLDDDGIPNYNFAVDTNNFQSSDWLSCISGKTGLPRLILTGLVLVSAWVMIWLCLTAANTAPDHHVKPEKLSINGDLEYLREVELEKIMASLYPQGFAETSPLPLKIRVEKI